MLMIGDWTVYRELDRLSQADKEVHITPKAMDVLVHLAENQGQLVSKEDLLNTHWRGSLSGDNAVHKTMAELRRVFDDDPKRPTYIETFPKRGYLLIADVQWQQAKVKAEPQQSAQDQALSPADLNTHCDVQDQRSMNPKLGILPFLNLVPGRDYEQFGFSIAEEITNSIGHTGLLTGGSHTSAFRFAQASGTNFHDPIEIGQALGVGFLLEGAIRKDQNILRVTTQLIDTKTGQQVWAKRFDHHIQEDDNPASLTLQHHIAKRIIDSLHELLGLVQLPPNQQTGRSPEQSYLHDIFD